MEKDEKKYCYEEKEIHPVSGWLVLFITVLLLCAALGLMIFFAIEMDGKNADSAVVGFVISLVYLCIGWIPFMGLRIMKPNEAIVLTLFGKYVGTVKGEGFYWYNPFCVPVRHVGRRGKMSLKAMTLDNGQQKINDELGNPIIIGIVVIWRVTNTAKAAFDV
ncbi:MAG: SPFH domain-containing protein, partial [[Eubacterium] saphenum]|nr:SPFH domain-containing protein [[Eubacterium] saphenum]